jgi:hypothetical protein
METIVNARPLRPALSAETLAGARGPGAFLHLNVHRLTQIYESEIASFLRASSAQVHFQPEAVAYSDMMVTYMLGIADLIDQVETIEASMRFGTEGLGVDLAARFVEGGSVGQFLSAQTPGRADLPPWGRTPLTSAVTLRMSPAARTSAVMKATRFFLDKSPRPDPLPETTKEAVIEAMQTVMESLGDEMTHLTGPAAPGKGIATDVAVYALADPEKFTRGTELLAAAWQRLADNLDLYLKIDAVPDGSEIAGVPVTLYVPRFRYGIPARHVQFKDQLEDQYGPEGLVYRVAVVGDSAVVATGTDLTLFRETIERLRSAAARPPAPEVARLRKLLPGGGQGFLALSLPLYLQAALLRGGTLPEKVGTVDPGAELVGMSLQADGPRFAANTWWPHEQLRLARELIERVMPEVADAPESLFEPTMEGPPAGPAEEPEAPAPAPLLPPPPPGGGEPAP